MENSRDVCISPKYSSILLGSMIELSELMDSVTSTMLLNLTVPLSYRLEIMSLIKSPIMKYSTFSLSSFKIRSSRSEKTAIGGSGGKYHVATKRGLDFGLWISRQRLIFLMHPYVGQDVL